MPGPETWRWQGRTLGRRAADRRLRVAAAADKAGGRLREGTALADREVPRSVPRPRPQGPLDWSTDGHAYRAELPEYVTVPPLAVGTPRSPGTSPFPTPGGLICAPRWKRPPRRPRTASRYGSGGPTTTSVATSGIGPRATEQHSDRCSRRPASVLVPAQDAHSRSACRPGGRFPRGQPEMSRAGRRADVVRQPTDPAARVLPPLRKPARPGRRRLRDDHGDRLQPRRR